MKAYFTSLIVPKVRFHQMSGKDIFKCLLNIVLIHPVEQLTHHDEQPV